MLKIVVMGYHKNCNQFIKKIQKEKDIEIMVVILPNNRGNKILETIKICNEYDIDWYVNVDNEMLHKIFSFLKSTPDLIVSISYMHKIPMDIVKIPLKGAINLHESLLPRNRGMHPLNWAIINGDKFTGATVHYITEDYDKGDIIEQRTLYIGNNDINFLSDKIAEDGSNLLVDVVKKFVYEKPKGKKQDEKKATYNSVRTWKDGKINDDFNIKQAIRMIYALKKPYPGAYVVVDGVTYVFYDGEIVHEYDVFERKDFKIDVFVESKNRLYCFLKNGIIRVNDYEIKSFIQ